MRIPNFLQNLFGEGALSAALIPEYTRLRAQGREAEAAHLAGAVAGLLAVVVSVAAGLGAVAAPLVVDLLVPGFEGPRRELTVRLVRIFFPGTALLVLSAWCLGILNSHRRFFLSYAAPVIWNLAIIVATLAGAAGRGPAQLATWTAWGAVIGGVLQLAIQLPRVWLLTGGVRFSLDRRAPAVRAVLRNFGPATTSRGVVQISGFVDSYVASWLPLGAVATLTNAQLLYTLPVSLFGMSVAAAELPELSEAAGGAEETRAARLRGRLEKAGGRIAFFVIPSAVAFLAFGHLIAGLLFQSGAFTAADARWVWGTLAGSTVGLLAATLARLYSSAHFALGDTRAPLRFAVVRVTVGLAFGVSLALLAPRLLGIDSRWGTAGLAAGSGIAGWIEFFLLRRSLRSRLGPLVSGRATLIRIWTAAAAAAGAAWLLLVRLPAGWGSWVVVLGTYGIVYLGLAAAFGVAPGAASGFRPGRSR